MHAIVIGTIVFAVIGVLACIASYFIVTKLSKNNQAAANRS